jgi:hypothetical protein
MVDHHIVPDADLAQEPWRCVGRVEASPPGAGGYQPAGTGTLVGPNLVLTASHVLEGRYFGDGWRFRFVPAYKQGAQRRDPQRGARTSADFTGRVITGNPSGKPGASGAVNNVNGWDFVVCELDDRLGDVWGHLGVWYPGKEYLTSHRWTSVGYPQGLGGRNPIRFPGIDISDVESDKYNSREIQTDDYVTGDFGPGGNTFSPGWSGGPLLGVHQGAWWVVGVLSGFEPNGALDLFNGENVFAGGQRLLDVHGQAHRDWLVDWTGWGHVGGAFKTAPAVVSWERNRLDIFGVGMNDGMYHQAWGV